MSSSSSPSVLLNTGVQMPLLGLGTYKLVGPEDVYQAVDAALAAGYRSFDSAAVYRNEADLGRVLKELLPKNGLTREDVFITSKLGPKDQGEGAMEGALRSLAQLDLGYIDLYLIHWPGTQGRVVTDQRNPGNRAESWAALEKLHAQGKLKAIGVSNYTPAHMRELIQSCKIPPALLQVEFHPRLCQTELRKVCEEYEVCFQAYSSLGKGELVTDPVVLEVSKNCERTPAQVLLRWAVQQGVPVLPKSSNPDRIKDNARLFDFTLSDTDMDRLSALDFLGKPTGYRKAELPSDQMSSSSHSVLLKTGVQMPLLGFGTYKLVSPEDVSRAVDAALLAGYRAFDSAAIYLNEAELGRALKQLLPKHGLTREDVFVTSKLGSKDQGERAMEGALHSLSDLDMGNRAESWAALEELHAQGKLKAIGVSNYTPAHMRELIQSCKIPPAVLQVEFHPKFCQTELRKVCEEYGVCFQAYSSLGKGDLVTDPVVLEVAKNCEHTPAQVLLRWAVQQGVPVLPKSSNPDRIKDNAKLFDFTLSDTDMDRLSALDCGHKFCRDASQVV
ncbi:putative oxidoreductase [Dissostichus eleginoides]|uniref:Oxidoreductase n=1 Tax=Dissostichus eleginoides TaxID=100907 RepID=A0AAD9F5I0_DISEL|nr:putative oxidoreductase [Dissostichus eleginoides]